MVLGGAPSTGKAWFGILGPLAAGVDGGQRLELAGRKQRELLAVLLINVNRCLPAGRIADALWRGAPPPGADVTLRTHVSHLRHRLAGIGAQKAVVTRQAAKIHAFMLTDITMTARFADSPIDRRTSTDIDPQDVHNAVSECDPAWYRRG